MAAQMDAFQQVHDHPYIRQQGRCPQSRLAQNQAFQLQFTLRRWFVPRLVHRWWFTGQGRHFMGRGGHFARGHLVIGAAASVKPFLQPFAGWSPVVGNAALVAALLAMMRSAAERAAQINSTGAARMRQKPDSAVRAESHAALQPRMGPQYRVQRDLILPDKRPGAIEFMPIRPKRENFLDGDDKKARLSVITRSLFFTPSSYLLDATASRGRARFFRAIKKNQTAALGAIDPQRQTYPTQPPSRANPSSLRPLSSNDYLEE